MINEELIKYINNLLYYAKRQDLVFSSIKSEKGVVFIVKYLSNNWSTNLLRLEVREGEVYIGEEYICFRSDLPIFVQEMISSTK